MKKQKPKPRAIKPTIRTGDHGYASQNDMLPCYVYFLVDIWQTASKHKAYAL